MDFVENEHKILKFWKENKIFEKLRKKNKGKKPWSFLDGPITANNPMGVHHAWGRTYKDLFQRYKAMQGFDERFQNGFDCQGLWVEVEVEKELGFKNKKDIERYGIENFVQKCKERVLKYSKIQTEQSIRLGQWMDWENSYYTMSDENNYAIWHFLKKCKELGLLYKGKDVVPWCPRCGTAISQHEILTEEYKEITHKSVFLKIPLSEDSNTFFLVWTTTPWTLPANVALAVHPDFVYAKVKDKDGNIFILLKDKKDLIEDGEIIEEFKGRELDNKEYKGIFDELEVVKKVMGDKEHKVVLWEEVTEEEGTGIVHIAPGCGQEDFQLSKKYNLPVVDPTDEESKYKEGFGFLTGKFVGEARDLIFENLKQKDLIFKIEDYTHRYPTCWRCKSELIFRLVDEWYISMDKLRAPLMETAKKIRWIPSFGLEREIDWLKNMHDWLISKKRYWGLALPIFECKKCGNFEVIGSKKELKERAVEGWEEFEGHSPHRPWVDKIKIKCSKCGEIISRISDVGTPWLDAGIVPFSTMGYFEDYINLSSGEKVEGREYWRKWFPADFICESFPGQFKNWFYVLLVMSQVLENTNPFKTVLGYATVVDEKGEEMHKSKGNAIWFDEAVEKIGADIMRWMYARQNPAYNMRFGFNIAKETRRKLLTLYNSYAFFETYKEENFKPENSDFNPENILDRWIISRLNTLIREITEFLDDYDAARASFLLENFFINDLSLWYIRRSRKRFQNPQSKEEKLKAQETLYFVLLTLAKLLAPFMPFFAEEMYQRLKTNDMPESVHLCDWPVLRQGLIDEELEKDMILVRDIASLGLSKRQELGIKIRQPLRKLKVRSEKLKNKNRELTSLIKEEVNVKEVVFDPEIKEEIDLDTQITKELKEEGMVREIIRHIQDLRKKQGLTPRDKVVVFWKGEEEIGEILKKNQPLILAEVRAEKIEAFNGEDIDRDKEIQVDGARVWLAIKKSFDS